MKIFVERFDKNLPLPKYDKKAACFDLTCREAVTIEPNGIKLVPANIAVQIPDGYTILIFARSSTPIKKGLMLANSVGVIDPFYCGDKDEVLIEFVNIKDEPVVVVKGELLAQGLLIKNEKIEWVEKNKFNEEGVGGYKVEK